MKRTFRVILALVICASLAKGADAQSTTLKYGDGRADGKQSLGGSGEMIEFGPAAGLRKIAGLKIHGSRYGMPQAPEESSPDLLPQPGSEHILIPR